MAKGKKQYSNEEKKAYYMGLGVGIGRGRQIKSTMEAIPAQLKESFKNGLDRGLTNPKKPVFKNKRR